MAVKASDLSFLGGSYRDGLTAGAEMSCGCEGSCRIDEALCLTASVWRSKI